MAEHVDIGTGEIHIAHNYSYADATAREGASSFVSADLGKIARQTDNNSYWVLTATTPVWVRLDVGAVVNAQTGTTYTVLAKDRGKLITHTNASAIAVTLPIASTTAFGADWYCWVQNRGAGVVTITPTTSTIDGAASLALAQNEGVLLVSDGTNYFTVRGKVAAAGSVTIAGDVTGTTAATVVEKASTSWALTGDISPSQITSDQNDYNPTGLSTASTLRLDTDANSGAGRSITGLQGGADGRIIVLHNVGSNPLRLKSENASSSAANRFSFPFDVVLGTKRSATLQYDATSSRWRLVQTTATALRHTVAISDETTAITTGTAKLTFSFGTQVYLLEVRARLATASSSGAPAFDVNEAGVSIFSTTLTVDANEETSTTAATPAVISDPNIADDAKITCDIDTAGTGAKGVKLTFIGWEL